MPLELFEMARAMPEIAVSYRELEILLGTEADEPDAVREAARKIASMAKAKAVACGSGCRDIVYNYKSLDAKTYFEHPVVAAMRGSVVRVYGNGEAKQVAFPFAKFFNMGEIEATKKLPRTRFSAAEKVDGTLIAVWIDPGTSEIRYNTRGLLDRHAVAKGRTFTYVQAAPGKVVNPYVVRFINAVKRLGLWYELESLAKEDRTLMFELVYKIPASYQFNVLETPEDSPDWKPYLLAYRDHRTLEVVYPEESAFPAPRKYTVQAIEDVLGIVEETEDKEGVVIHYPGLSYHPELPWWNYLVKVKNRVYVLKAYIGSGRTTWKHLALLVLDGKEDDVIPVVDEEKAAFMKMYREKYNRLLEEWTGFADLVFALEEEEEGDKIYNVLTHNLRMGYITGYLKAAETEIEKGRDRGSAIEAALRRAVREMLVHKNSGEALLGALDRFHKRIGKAKKQLMEIYGRNREKHTALRH